MLVESRPQSVDLSRQRLAKFKNKTVFVQRNFKEADWSDGIAAGFASVVSLQAVHELRHASRIPKLYAQLHGLLAPCGMIPYRDDVNARSGHRAAHFKTGQRTPGDFQESGIYRAERNLPCRGFVSDGGGEALRAIALFHRSAEHHAAPYRMGCIWI